MRDRERDHGSMVVLVAMVAVALTVAIGTALVPVVHRLGNQQRAQAAADAAALAGVVGGEAASARLAAANGGALVAWTSAGSAEAMTVTVTVEVGGEAARARATNGP